MEILDRIKSALGLDGARKDGVSERVEPVVKGALYRGGDKRDFLGRIEPSNHGLDDMLAWNRMLENGRRENERYAKEHFGDYDKKDGIDAPTTERSQTKDVMANVTQEQAKTLLQSDAHHALSLNPKERKEHYKNVRETQGGKALEKLLSEVRKQRTKTNALEM